MPGLINLTKWLSGQGIDKNTLHQGEVVDNKDPRRLCRARVKIPTILEGIPDDCLPWAMPLFSSFDNIVTGEDRSGIGMVPRVGSKVLVQFLNGDVYCPVMLGCIMEDINEASKKELKGGPSKGEPKRGAAPEDLSAENAALAGVTNPDASGGEYGDALLDNYIPPEPVETKKSDQPDEDHYPDRSFVRMTGGTYIVVDSKTHEIFVNASSDFYLTILGDVNETIVGNKTTTITTKTDDIPEYVKVAPNADLSLLKQQRNEKLAWKGLTETYLDNGGNSHTYIEGDYSMEVKGYVHVKIHKDSKEEILGKSEVRVTDDLLFTAQNIYQQES